MRQDLIAVAKLLATPVDFASLVAEGVLVPHGAWYEVRDSRRLPEHARRQITGVKTNTRTNLTLVKFSRPNRQTARAYERLTGEKLPP